MRISIPQQEQTGNNDAEFHNLQGRVKARRRYRHGGAAMKQVLTAELLDGLYGWLAECAAAGRQCPGNREIARRYGFASGATAAKAVARLERDGRIRVRRGWSARQATIIATGRSTAAVEERRYERRRRVAAVRRAASALGPRIPGPGGRQCQWIEGEPGEDDNCKCLRVTAAGDSWCRAHRARVYLPPEVAEARFGPLPGTRKQANEGRGWR